MRAYGDRQTPDLRVDRLHFSGVDTRSDCRRGSDPDPAALDLR